ncbi:ATP-binding protein [Arthrobacter sp. YN]|uniref:ATP-binding protein n=1 Tax=Arthrobacter sp. YN TaxID=2020486 RepID=UPI000B5DE27E|nr:ATP-binding protein [Arthrobacter sp. YN]ASN19937.1 ATPase [Arthrobacter sp. YN]
MSDITSMARVIAVGPDLIEIEVTSTDEYEQLEDKLEIGSYLKVSDENGSSVVALVQSFRIRDIVANEQGTEITTPKFILSTQPVGRLENGKFRRGGKQITIPPKRVEIATSDLLREIYDTTPEAKKFSFGHLVQDPNVAVSLDGDKFFGKHIGVVGSTGSGKSSTVAAILQEGVKASNGTSKPGALNNSHVIIFDLHGEYSAAFPDATVIGVDDIKLPYWLMNSEELEEMFIESNEQNSHNQVSQFRRAVIENKERHNSGSTGKISYDSPVYFSLAETVNYLTHLNSEVVSKLPDENLPKFANGDLVHNRADHYFEPVKGFVEQSQSKTDKASSGPFNGEFNRFLMRLEGRRGDKRLDFLLNPMKTDDTPYQTEDLPDLLRQFMGYGSPNSNVTIIDLSGIPFEVLSVVVSLITRLIFTFNFHFKKYRTRGEAELPYLLVYEEAHNYIPQSEGAKYGSVKRAIERIAKEGRKYGISLMIVSQRPSEISETVFSQCNNFVAMRLTNPADQRYVKRLLPDSLSAITDSLPSLERQEAIVIGDSIVVPSLIKVTDIKDLPDSHDIDFHTEWKKEWLDVGMKEIVETWQG